MNKFLASVAVAAMAVAFGSCTKQPEGWIVEGSVNIPDSTVMVIEAGNNGRWYTIDTVAHTDGVFKYVAGEAAAYPDVMRLAYDGQYIYFPIDSIDVVNVISAEPGHYTLSGTPTAETLSSLDSLIRAKTILDGAANIVNDENFKKSLFARAYSAPTVLPAYYLLNRSVGASKLFDPSRKADLRVYGAVAQRFSTERPDDLRGKFITRQFLQAKALEAGVQPSTQITVPQTGIIDITRSDSKGVKHSLADVASKGNVVILSFTNYTSEFSPAYNVALGELYEANHPAGLEIYQIAFDGDETMWRQTAANLPWITVWNSTTDDFQPITSYNVGALPTTFIIDRQGQIRQRVDDPSALTTEVKKYL